MTLTVLFAAFAALLVMGLPIGVAMAASGALVLLTLSNVSIVFIAQGYFNSIDSFALLAVPLFLLAGELMAISGITVRLVDFSRAMMGHLRGGLAQATVLSNMFMAAISGSALADLVAIGSIMMPAMKKEGYRPRFVSAITSCAAMLGPIIPPSVILVVYGSITGVSIGALFLGGIVPGVLAGTAMMALAWLRAPGEGAKSSPRASGRERLVSFRRALPAVVMPVIIVGGISSGAFTPTEAGAFAVVYALTFGLLLRKHTGKSIAQGMLSASLTAAAALITLCGAAIFSWILAREGIAQTVMSSMLSVAPDPTLALFVLMAFFFLVGTFLEPTPAMIITVPLLQPLVANYGYDPVHFGIFTVMMLVLGAITPPVGILAMVAGKMAGISASQAFGGLFPFVGVWLIVTAFVALNPWTATLLPSLFN
jgi:tripartite ATP-independent transporter DctM subunit